MTWSLDALESSEGNFKDGTLPQFYITQGAAGRNCCIEDTMTASLPSCGLRYHAALTPVPRDWQHWLREALARQPLLLCTASRGGRLSHHSWHSVSYSILSAMVTEISSPLLWDANGHLCLGSLSNFSQWLTGRNGHI